MSNFISKILKIIFLFSFSFISIIVFDLIIKPVNHGIFYQNRTLVRSLFLCLISLLCVYGTCLTFYKSSIISKIIILILIFLGLTLLILYLIKNTTWFSKFSTIKELREYILSFKNVAIIFVLIQILQVVLLPIPSIIVTGAGVIIFGPIKCALFSSVGIIVGSVICFITGRFLGYKFISWFFGKERVDELLLKLESKYKLFLFFAFLFPFFPDDTLCALSGTTKIKFIDFFIIVFFTRIFSVFISCFTFSNNLLPLNKWWGVVVIVAIFASAFICTKMLFCKKLIKHK